MVMENFVNELFDIALKNGCEAAEAYYAEGDAFEAGVLDGELDTYSVSHTYALNLRVNYKGKTGYACTEKICDAQQLVRHAIDNAQAIESDDIQPMQGKCSYKSVSKERSAILDMSESERIALAFDMERRVNSKNARVMMCNVACEESCTSIRNTLGLCAKVCDAEALIYTNAVVTEGEESKDGFAFRKGNEALDITGCADEAVKEAAEAIGAEPVAGGEYRAVFRNDAAASLLESFFQMFSADAAQKGLSLLAGRENEKIGSDMVTIIDDPFHEYAPRAFDAQGVPSVTTTVIENGLLKTLLYDLKTAFKAGKESTSNAGRGSVFAPTSIMPSNFYMLPGEKSRDELIELLGNGLYITEISGTHAGVNTVSGEFSLLAKGHLVENGCIIRPVDKITVSGTFLGFLQSIEQKGDDLKFSIPQSGNVGSPSLLVKSVLVAGK